MSAFLDWFYAFLTSIVEGFWKILSGIFNGIVQIFNIPNHFRQIALYKDGFNALSWVLFIFSSLIFLGIVVILI